jgi:hypothetical protein
MKKTLKIIVALILLFAAAIGGFLISAYKDKYHSANDHLYFNLVLYELLQSGNYRKMNDLLQGSIYINYSILTEKDKLDSSIKNNQLNQTAIQVCKEVNSGQSQKNEPKKLVNP